MNRRLHPPSCDFGATRKGIMSDQMSRTNYIFVDFENVQDVDLAVIGSQAVSFTLLVGPRQTKLAVSLVENLSLGAPVKAEQQRIVAKVDELMRWCGALEARLPTIVPARLSPAIVPPCAHAISPDEIQKNRTQTG
jgi:hypothetical protein